MLKTKIEINYRQLYIIDAKAGCLGRLVVKIVKLLQFFKLSFHYLNPLKNLKLVILNSSKLSLSANKLKNKEYMKYSGYFGGESYIKLKDLYEKNPNKIIFLALKNMLPKNNFFKNYLRKNVKIYSGDYFSDKIKYSQYIHCN